MSASSTGYRTTSRPTRDQRWAPGDPRLDPPEPVSVKARLRSSPNALAGVHVRSGGRDRKWAVSSFGSVELGSCAGCTSREVAHSAIRFCRNELSRRASPNRGLAPPPAGAHV
jgi:hypothetical protein